MLQNGYISMLLTHNFNALAHKSHPNIIRFSQIYPIFSVRVFKNHYAKLALIRTIQPPRDAATEICGSVESWMTEKSSQQLTLKLLLGSVRRSYLTASQALSNLPLSSNGIRELK